jgi:hypothetical protein
MRAEFGHLELLTSVLSGIFHRYSIQRNAIAPQSDCNLTAFAASCWMLRADGPELIGLT